jgi:hypothetical protein
MRSSNASASAFGWEFQSNAAIMLMLNNIERASKVKVEGSTEDIEITFSDGKMLMSQAKAVTSPDDYSHVKDKLSAGLKTLNNAAKLPDVEQLVFVTNSPNPFNDTTTMYKFSSPVNTVPFSELPTICKETINDICNANGYDFDTSQLSVCVMQFHGENEEERFKVLSTLTTEFLNKLGAHRIPTSQLLTLWQHTFSVNASQITTAITKKRMVWPIIAILCEVNEDDAALEDYDDNDIDEIVDKYKNVINNNSECFEFVTKVLSDFNDFQAELPSKERVKMFIDESWHSYDDYFDIKSATPAIKEIVIRLTLYNILRKRSVIATIKGKVKL